MTHKELEKLYDSVMRKKEAKDRAEEYAQTPYLNTVEESIRQYDKLAIQKAFTTNDVVRVKNGLVLLKGGKYELRR